MGSRPKAPPAGYGDAPPEQVAKAVLTYRSDGTIGGATGKPWLRLGITADPETGAPHVTEITEHDERPPLPDAGG